MAGIGYLRMEEIPGIPVLPRTPGAVVYAPLGDTPVDPDVVLFWGPAARVMLRQEASALLTSYRRASVWSTERTPDGAKTGLISLCRCVGGM